MIITFNCSQCGAPNNDVKVDDGAKKVACMYCSAANVVTAGQQASTSVATPVQLTCKKCPKCNSLFTLDCTYCTFDGTPLEVASDAISEKFCNECKTKHALGELACHKGHVLWIYKVGNGVPAEAKKPAQVVCPEPKRGTKIVAPVDEPKKQGASAQPNGCLVLIGGMSGLVIWIVSSIVVGFILYVTWIYLAAPYKSMLNAIELWSIWKSWGWIQPWDFFEHIFKFFIGFVVFLIAFIPGILWAILLIFEWFNVPCGWGFWPALMSRFITLDDLLT